LQKYSLSQKLYFLFLIPESVYHKEIALTVLEFNSMSAFDKKAAMAAMTAGINSVTNVLTMANNQFTVKTGKESKRVTTHDKDLGANGVDMIIVAANPNTTQVFYKDVYKAGSNEAPTCYSDNGVGPSSQAAAPQALLCASCPRNEGALTALSANPARKSAVLCRHSAKPSCACLGCLPLHGVTSKPALTAFLT
jgi:hypothetical protein